MLLKVSTARNVLILLVGSADHITGLASATLTITASKDGAAFASITPTVTDLGSGWYNLALTTTHTNTKGTFALHITATSADPTDVLHEVVTDLPGDSVASVTGNVTGNVGGSVASVTAGVTVTTNNDKTGYSLTQAFPTNFSALGISAGGAISTVTTVTTTTNLTNAAAAGDFTATMKTSIGTAVAASAVASVTGAVGSIASGGITDASFAAATGKKVIRASTAQAGASTSITLDASASATNSIYVNCLIYLTGGTGAGQARFITAYVGSTKVATVTAWQTNPDNTSTFAILPFDAIPGATAPTASQVAQAVCDEALSGHTTAGSVGKALSDTLTDAGAIKTQTDKLAFTVTNQVDANVLDWKSAAAPAMTGDAFARLGAPAGASVSADIAGVLSKTPDSAHYTTARGDKLDDLDATVSSRLASSGYTAPDNTDIAAIKAKTDNLPASPAATSDIPSAATIAAAVQSSATTTPLPANIKKVDDVTIQGAGTTGSPWVPA